MRFWCLTQGINIMQQVNRLAVEAFVWLTGTVGASRALNHRRSNKRNVDRRLVSSASTSITSTTGTHQLPEVALNWPTLALQHLNHFPVLHAFS